MVTGLGFVKWPAAARLVGLSENTLRRYVSQRKVPFFKVGSLVFFDPERLRLWIEEKRVEPITRDR